MAAKCGVVDSRPARNARVQRARIQQLLDNLEVAVLRCEREGGAAVVIEDPYSAARVT